MMPRATILWWLRLVGSLAVVALLLTVVPARAVWDALRSVHPGVWLACVVVFLAGHAINAMKLRLLIGPSVAPASACLRAHFAGLAANLGLPGVAGGDVVRVSCLAPTAGMARVAMAAVADRIVDFSVLLVLAGLAARVAGVPTALAAVPASGARWIAIAAAGILLVVWAVGRKGGAEGQRRAAIASWRAQAHPSALLAAAAMSLGVQSAFVLTNAWLGAQAGVRLPLAPWFVAWTVSKLSAVLPISLGGIGVREAALVSVLAAYGAPAGNVLAAGILWQAANVAGSLAGFIATQALPRRQDYDRR